MYRHHTQTDSITSIMLDLCIKHCTYMYLTDLTCNDSKSQGVSFLSFKQTNWVLSSLLSPSFPTICYITKILPTSIQENPYLTLFAPLSKSDFVNRYPQCCKVCRTTGEMALLSNAHPLLTHFPIKLFLQRPLIPAHFFQRPICLSSSLVRLPK